MFEGAYFKQSRSDPARWSRPIAAPYGGPVAPRSGSHERRNGSHARRGKERQGTDVDHVASLLLGLGNGGVYAALALALVLTYRSSGVINFATGAIALYVGLHVRVAAPGRAAPVPPRAARSRSTSAPSSALFPAATIALAASPRCSARCSTCVVFRPLRDAPPLAQAVASLGVLVVIQGVDGDHRGHRAGGVKAIFPAERWELGLADGAVGPLLPRRRHRAGHRRRSAASTGSPGSGSSPGPRPSRRPAPTSAASRPTASRS